MACVGPDAYSDALRQQHTREMGFTGKPMKGYILVTSAGFESDSALDKWVNLCAKLVESLSPK